MRRKRKIWLSELKWTVVVRLIPVLMIHVNVPGSKFGFCRFSDFSIELRLQVLLTIFVSGEQGCEA